MPITINSSADNRLGLISLSLGDYSVNFDGTAVGPAARDGLINTTLAGYSVSFQGQYAAPENREGQISIDIDDYQVQFIGNQIQTIDGRISATLGEFEVNLINIDSSDAEADWQNRINQEGVVWFHNFASAAEVDAFRWYGGIGNDPGDTGEPGTMIHDAADGITGGGCLSMVLTVAQQPQGAAWWRPLSPLTSPGNGKAQNDPGANGSISAKAYDPSNASEVQNWNQGGFYGHPDYHAASPGQFDGHGYYLQMRYKADSRRRAGADGGKNIYLSRTDQSLTSQEIVTVAMQDGNVSGSPFNFFSMYRSGSPPLTNDEPGPENQVDGDLGFCDWPTDIAGCWYYPDDEWCTLLYHVTPMRNSDGQTRVRVWAQKPGETEYTQIWNQRTVNLGYGAGEPFGHNALICSGYQQTTMPTTVTQKWDELAFSKYPIRNPWDKESAMKLAADGLSLGQSVNFTPNTTQKPIDIQWNLQTIFYDELRGGLQYMGKPASGQPNGLEYSHYLYDEYNDTWTDVGIVSSGSGHVWSLTFDPDNGDYYWSNGGQLKRFRRRKGVALSSWETLSSTSDLTAGGLGAPILGWHPNLFGPGKPGLYGHNAFYGLAWNPETDSWSRCRTTSWPSGSAYRDKNNGQAIYMPESDRLVLFGRNKTTGNEESFYIDAGAGLSSDVIADGLAGELPETPITVRGSGNFNVHGHIVQSPTNRNHVYCLQEHGTPNVWKSTDGANTWVLKGYTHPFNAMSGEADEWTVGTIHNYRCIVAMSSDSAGGETVLWKPND